VTEGAYFTFSDINPAYKINRLVFEMREISGFRVVSQIVCLGNSSTSGEQNGRVPGREKAGFRIDARNSFHDNRFAGSGECRLYVRQWFHRTPSEWRIIESAMVNSLGEETILRA